MESENFFVCESEKQLTIDLNCSEWKIENSESNEKIIFLNRTGLYVENKQNEQVKIRYKRNVLIENEKYICMYVKTGGSILRNGGVDILINGWSIPENGMIQMPLKPPVKITIELVVKPDSSAVINEFQLFFLQDEKDLCELCGDDRDILVVTPSYPSNQNLYLAAFAHSRNRAYVEHNMKIQVAVLNANNWYEKKYEYEGVPVITGQPLLLKKLLAKKQYKMIIVHFVDKEYYQIFDEYISNEQLVFICHGPETTFEILPNVARPYFTSPIFNVCEGDQEKKEYVQKYSMKKNVSWIFVSEWLKNKSEECLKTRFYNAYCIGNVIDEKLFPYIEKKTEERKKILVLRKFDNFAYHSIDIVVRAILILSTKTYFNELEFDIYGDGNYYDELVNPIKSFKNVHLHRTFLRNSEIREIHRNHGIMFIPSRHDSQGVSMGEAASSGVIPLGSNVTCLPYFVDNKNSKILTDPEDPYALVENYERFYYNPEEFVRVSRELSTYVQKICGREQTIEKEIKLLQQVYDNWKSELEFVEAKHLIPEFTPVLTIVIFVHGGKKYIEKCILSLLNSKRIEKCEILLITNDTLKQKSIMLSKIEKSSNGLVRIINEGVNGIGTAISKGIAEARGKYIKFISDYDWCVSEKLDELIDILLAEKVDLFLTDGYMNCVLENRKQAVKYHMLSTAVTYKYSDLLYPLYGFEFLVPGIGTSFYKNECIRKRDWTSLEKSEYGDIEFGFWSQQYIDTVKYYNLEIFKHADTICEREIYEDTKCQQLESLKDIIIRITNYLENTTEYPEVRKKYMSYYYLSPLVDKVLVALGNVKEMSELFCFIRDLEKYDSIADVILKYIKERGKSANILNSYKEQIIYDNSLEEK